MQHPLKFHKHDLLQDWHGQDGGRVLGGIETKVGKSPYTALQRLKDLWMEKVQGYPVQLVRKP